MAHVVTWKIVKMDRVVDTGAVDNVVWQCKVIDDTHTDCKAVDGGRVRFKPDPSASDFINYDDLTEATVLGWVYNQLTEDEETSEEAKARVENNRKAKVDAQIANKTARASGVPW